MNALEMLLQRIRSSGAPDPDWQAHLADLGGGLPPQDEYIRSPGQGGINTFLHPNALGVYGGGERPPPAGDQVWGPGQINDVVPSTTPLVSQQEMRKWLNPNPDSLPGPDGLLRISAGGGGMLERLEELRQAPTEPTYTPSERSWSLGQPLHPNAAGIYGGAPRPPPAGDVVIPSTDQRGELAAPWMPRSSIDEFLREDRTVNQPSRLPGPYGATRISAGLPSALNQLMRRLPYGQY